MANTSRSILVNRDVLLGVAFALLAALGFSAKAILVKLAYLDNVDAVTLLALRMVFSLPFFAGTRFGLSTSMPSRSARMTGCSYWCWA